MIGRSNARRGARRIFAVLQNRRLNQHLAYTILDEVRTFLVRWLVLTQQHLLFLQLIAALFPEAFA
jgi:sorting nexin-25